MCRVNAAKYLLSFRSIATIKFNVWETSNKQFFMLPVTSHEEFIVLEGYFTGRNISLPAVVRMIKEVWQQS